MSPDILERMTAVKTVQCGIGSLSIEYNRNAIAVRRWMVAGCFKNSINDSPLPFDKINPNGSWFSCGRDISWQDYTVPVDSDEVDMQLEDYTDQTNGLVYLATYIYSRKDNDCILITDYSGGTYKIIQNGSEILDVGLLMNSPNACRITLLHGWNLLLVKLEKKSELPAVFYGGLCFTNSEPFDDGWIKTGFMEGDDIDTQMFGKSPEDVEQAIEIGRPKDEVARTRPDVVVYVPKEGDEHNDGDNEHFLVFRAPKSEELLAMWTQGSMEPSGDNHIVIARSEDGLEFSDPQWIVGTHKDTDEDQASWGFPVVSEKTGRIYCFYCVTPKGKLGGAGGILGCHISDDNGCNWSYAGEVLMPDCFADVNDRTSQNGNIIVWQKPILDSKGRQIVGYTYVGPEYPASCCKLMRFDNIDEGPDIENLQISWLSENGRAVAMPAEASNLHCSEPAIVLLEDGRLFMVMRTVTGNIWYSVSDDDGVSWCTPEVLRYRDGGEPVKNPLTCCPIYQLEDGRFMLIYYNNSYYADLVAAGKPIPAGMSMFTHRRPAVFSIGHFKPHAHQPIWFDEPKDILDTDGVIVSPKASNEIATYPSITSFKGKQTLWYPDRKYFLLGKHITDELLDG